MTTRFSDGVEEEETLSAIVPDASGPISVPTSAIAPPTQVVVTAANPVVPPGQCSQVQLNVTNANIAALGASENGQGVAVQVSAVGSVGVFNSSNCAGPSVTLVSVSGAGPVSLYVKNAGDPGVAGPLSVADIKAEVVNVAAPAAVQAVPIEQQDSI